ncbi:hypothetical protein V8G54_009568 [Vigna mungo]|uniref:Disease resistance protein n=1 Tax=Vigna mungo TaxID=3915 RepID=A0AAQ3NU92_VIGMU
MQKLKILNLSHSHYLTKTPDFLNLPNLEKLVLMDCPRLSEVSFTIGHLTKIDKLEEDIKQMESLTTLVADKTAIRRVPFSIVRSKSIGYISLCGYEGFSRDVFPSIIWSWMSPVNSLSSRVQTLVDMSSLVSLDVQNSSSNQLSYISEELPKLQSLWIECGSDLQLSRDTTSILDALNATNSEESESYGTTSQIQNRRQSRKTLKVGNRWRAWVRLDFLVETRWQPVSGRPFVLENSVTVSSPTTNFLQNYYSWCQELSFYPISFQIGAVGRSVNLVIELEVSWNRGSGSDSILIFRDYATSSRGGRSFSLRVFLYRGGFTGLTSGGGLLSVSQPGPPGCRERRAYGVIPSGQFVEELKLLMLSFAEGTPDESLEEALQVEQPLDVLPENFEGPPGP